jgi:hypothetical protein
MTIIQYLDNLQSHNTRDSFKIAQQLTSGYKQKDLSQFLHRHLDSFIVTQNFSSVYQIRDFGSGQILLPGQFYLLTGLAKIAPWWLARRDYFSSKVPGLVTANCATNAFCSYPLAVRCQSSADYLMTNSLTTLLHNS